MLPGNASRRPAIADSACRHQTYAGQVESALLKAIDFVPAKACESLPGLNVEIWGSGGDRQQGHPTARQSFHHPKVSGKVSDVEAVRWIENLYG